ncbi:hypothetical protein PFISCL1PPCAC_16011, partial [Pristionchus fissidentatus]
VDLRQRTTGDRWIDYCTRGNLSLLYHENVSLRSIETNCIDVDRSFTQHIDDVGVDHHWISSSGLIGASTRPDDVVHSEHVSTTNHMRNSRSRSENLKRVLVRLSGIDFDYSRVIPAIENGSASSRSRIHSEVLRVESKSVVVENRVGESTRLIRQPDDLISRSLSSIDIRSTGNGGSSVLPCDNQSGVGTEHRRSSDSL